MYTNPQPNHPEISYRMSVPEYEGKTSRRMGNRQKENFLRNSVIRADQMFGAARGVREAQIKQALAEAAQEKAELANKAKTDFLANMTHEIRTPLSAIMGLASILQTTKLDDKQKKCMTVLQSSANDLMTMINESLDIDKIESNTINLEHAPFNMSALLHHIISVMSVKAQEKGIGLSLHDGAGISKIFVGDHGRVQQIVMNLVGNAIKFTQTGQVTVSFAEHGNEDGQKEISISVTDTGIGIPPDKVDAIFKRFVQADSSITHRFGGTGLGLSISKALAESMGGTITVDSIIGQGSTFAFSLKLPTKQTF